MPELLYIHNDGPRLIATNYWDTDAGRRGAAYLSVNAGAFRLILPPALESYLPEMRVAREAVVSRGPWPQGGQAEALELLFEDGSDSPFAVHLGAASFDRLPTDADAGKAWRLTVWVREQGVRPREALSLPASYRRVPTLPWMKPRN